MKKTLLTLLAGFVTFVGACTESTTVEAAFSSYEEARLLLATDQLEGVAHAARRVGEHARAATDAARAADQLAGASDLEEARARFGDLSRELMKLTEANPRLRKGWHVFECPMAQASPGPWGSKQGFGKWFQRPPEIHNPYMGSAMPKCGSASDWTVEGEAPTTTGNPDEIAYYTCPMHPSVQQDEPGACPICGMDLTPVSRGEVESGMLLVDEVRRQKIGVKTAPVERRGEQRSLRTLGRVVYDERKVHDVTLKLEGWIHTLHVDETGQQVKKGQTLFTLYSPELFAAQVEYLQAVKLANQANIEGLSGSLASAARTRLKLWNLTDAQIDSIARRGKPLENMPIVSPASGYVIEKDVARGSKVTQGQRVFRVAELDEVWVEADLYEADLAQVSVGQRVEVTLPYLPGQAYEGRISFIYPFLDQGARVGRVRVELKNAELQLRPNMYANVAIQLPQGEGLWVPADAVIYTGPRRIVFVDLGEGRLRPQEIKIGRRSGSHYEVLAGLDEGDVIVTSGNFLVAAESRIRSATTYWADDGRDRR